ncbi:ferrochelatase [Methylocystis bryophila]|uniref:ferrochelatase n=1 Tax=Methylocystis bryophila TaxID=655015 RepID=UPI0018F84DE1|nr:ferrochelatase [Methylocystis bryophila]BDV38109.1 ferrochelatase [Methylocystis bryophila]
MTPFDAAPIGVLLVNLGTPDAPEPQAVRRYLAEFLSDPRVVELPKLFWAPALHGIVLPLRAQKSAQAYAAIWNKELNDSPLRAITRAQAEGLAERMRSGASGASPVLVDFAMRYGAPSLQAGLTGLMSRGCERILIMPLYPQYAAATTATAFDAVARILGGMRRQPTLRFLPPYFDDPAYIDALASSLRAGVAALDFEPEVMLASFHGLPRSQVDAGDPYKAQCEASWRLLREAMGVSERQLRLSFQSRFGRAKWIEPYTTEVVKALAREGVKRLVVMTPGFSADCLETLEEIGLELRDEFLQEGGEKFARITCLNDGEEGMRLLETLARRELQGWA